ncbi:MAG: TrkA family potassium uptake protein [Acidimicrobiales bacterium]|nr:TrkA family potassium uptake protein [Acidimicrobiales bacterium]
MRVCIAGGGNVGSFIAVELRDAGHDVLVLEQDPVVFDRRASIPGIAWHQADACEYRSLERADLAACDVVIAATGDDEDNLVVALLARQEFAVPRVIARVNHPQNEWLFNETWGVDVAVSTPHLLTSLVEEAVSVGSLVRLLQLEGGSVSLLEITLAENSPALGSALKDLSLPRDATVVAVLRRQHVIVPRGDTVLEVGDEVMILSTPAVEPAVRALLAAQGAR